VTSDLIKEQLKQRMRSNLELVSSSPQGRGKSRNIDLNFNQNSDSNTHFLTNSNASQHASKPQLKEHKPIGFLELKQRGRSKSKDHKLLATATHPVLSSLGGSNGNLFV